MMSFNMEALSNNLEGITDMISYQDSISIYVEGKLDMKVYSKYKPLANKKYIWFYEKGNKLNCIKCADGKRKYSIVDRDNDDGDEESQIGVIKTNYYSIDNLMLLYPSIFSISEQLHDIRKKILILYNDNAIKDGNEIINVNHYKIEDKECIYPIKCNKMGKQACSCVIISSDSVQKNVYPFDTEQVFLENYRFKDTMKKYTSKKKVNVEEHEYIFYSNGSKKNIDRLIKHNVQ